MPFFAQLIVKNLLGILSDQLKKRKLVKSTVLCKVFQVTGRLPHHLQLKKLEICN